MNTATRVQRNSASPPTDNLPVFNLFLPSSMLPANVVRATAPDDPYPLRGAEIHLYDLVLVPVDARPPTDSYALCLVEAYDPAGDHWLLRPITQDRRGRNRRRRAADAYHPGPAALGYRTGHLYAYSGPLQVAPAVLPRPTNNGTPAGPA